MSGGLLQIRHLGFAYPEGKVFRDWSADIGPGVSWVVGDESSGKTTLLHLLAGRLCASGSIAWAGGEPLRPEQVAWEDGRDARLDGVSMADFFESVGSGQPAFDSSALGHHVDGFGLGPHLSKTFHQLSTGSRRKAAMAASLACGARLTLFDDPTAALDAASVGHLMRTLDAYATDPNRLWIATGYEAPRGLSNAQVVRLPERA